MKKIKLNGKLHLNKEVVSKLNDREMRNVKGGANSAIACYTDNFLSLGDKCSIDVDICGKHETRGMFCDDNPPR